MADRGPDGRMVPTFPWRAHTPTNRAAMGLPSNESSDRAARRFSAAAPTEPRVRTLHSRPPSHNGSRRPDRRICGDWGSLSCAPTLWKGVKETTAIPRSVAAPTSIDSKPEPPKPITSRIGAASSCLADTPPATRPWASARAAARAASLSPRPSMTSTFDGLDKAGIE